MKTKITVLLFFFSISIWSQTSSGSGTTTSGGGPGSKITISSLTNSNTIEILPELSEAKVIGYKIYDSNLELKVDASTPPTNNETIVVENISQDKYYVQLFLDKEEESKQVITKQFIKQ